MSNKQHFLEILARLKAHADENDDAELHIHLNELENAISAMDATDDGDGSGGNHPTDPSGKP